MQIRTTARRVGQATRPAILAAAVELAAIGLAAPLEAAHENEGKDPLHCATQCSGYMVAVG